MAPAQTRPVRHRIAAGRAMLAAVVCLATASLLNADSLHATANRQPYGAKRDVAMAFAEPLREVSHALYLDRPRYYLGRLLGSTPPGATAAPSGASSGSRPPGAPETNTPVPSGPTAPERRMRKPRPGQPLTMWIAGDSQAGIFGQSLVNLAAETQVIDAALDFRISTGLSRPDVFDWPAHIEGVTAAHDPDIVVLVFGANDGQPIMTATGPAEFDTPEWRAEYRRRLEEVTTVAARNGRTVIWAGQPIVQNEERAARLAVTNEVIKEATAGRTDAYYVDSWSLFAVDAGYAQYMTDASGQLVRVREGDGTHLTREGGNMLAAKVLDLIRALSDIDSWRQSPPPEPPPPPASAP